MCLIIFFSLRIFFFLACFSRYWLWCCCCCCYLLLVDVVTLRCLLLCLSEPISTNKKNSQFVYFDGFSKHCRHERNDKKRRKFFLFWFVVGWFGFLVLLANDGSLCTHNPIHSFALSGHFTKSEKKKIDCPEKTGYRLDVQYAELCKMATAEMELLLTFFLFSSKPFDASYSCARLVHRFAYYSNAYMHAPTPLYCGRALYTCTQIHAHHNEPEKPREGQTRTHTYHAYTPSV